MVDIRFVRFQYLCVFISAEKRALKFFVVVSCLRRVNSQMLPNKKDVRLQQRISRRSSFQSKTSTVSSSSSKVRDSSSQLKAFPSTSVQMHCIASTSPPTHHARLDCTSELPFYKPKWRSKSNLPVSQINTRQSSLTNDETCSKREVITWV